MDKKKIDNKDEKFYVGVRPPNYVKKMNTRCCTIRRKNMFSEMVHKYCTYPLIYISFKENYYYTF
jgi:hypothetical protein